MGATSVQGGALYNNIHLQFPIALLEENVNFEYDIYFNDNIVLSGETEFLFHAPQEFSCSYSLSFLEFHYRNKITDVDIPVTSQGCFIGDEDYSYSGSSEGTSNQNTLFAQITLGLPIEYMQENLNVKVVYTSMTDQNTFSLAEINETINTFPTFTGDWQNLTADIPINTTPTETGLVLGATEVNPNVGLDMGFGVVLGNDIYARKIVYYYYDQDEDDWDVQHTEYTNNSTTIPAFTFTGDGPGNDAEIEIDVFEYGNFGVRKFLFGRGFFSTLPIQAPTNVLAKNDANGNVHISWEKTSSLATNALWSHVKRRDNPLDGWEEVHHVSGADYPELSTQFTDETADTEKTYEYFLENFRYWTDPCENTITNGSGVMSSEVSEVSSLTATSNLCREIHLNWSAATAPGNVSFNNANLEVKYNVALTSDPYTFINLNANGEVVPLSDTNFVFEEPEGATESSYSFRVYTVLERTLDGNKKNFTFYDRYASVTGEYITQHSPFEANDFSLSQDDETSGVKITWATLSGLADGELADLTYTFVNDQNSSSSQSVAGNSANITIVGDSSYYIDNSNLEACTPYNYKIRTNYCETTLETTEKPIILAQNSDNTFTEEKNLEASKGYYADRIQLNWDNRNNAVIDHFTIVRRIYEEGEEEDKQYEFVEIGEVSNATHTFIDEYAQAGVLYEYKIQAVFVCLVTNSEGAQVEEETIKLSAPAIGFRMPDGAVSGHIEYEGGNSVRDVKVLVQATEETINRSLYFDGSNSYVDIASFIPLIYNEAKGDTDDSYAFSAWVKPTDIVANGHVFAINTSGGGNVTLLYFTGNTLSLYCVENPGTNETVHAYNVIEADADKMLDNWNHIALSYNDATNQIFVAINGVQSVLETSSGVESLFAIHESNVEGNKITIGQEWDGNTTSEHFEGYMDEIRIWNSARTQEQIANTYNRYLKKNEEGLIAAYHCDEGLGDWLYDTSKNDNQYNKNDGQHHHMAYSDDTPTSEQIGNVGFTDENGNYIIEAIRYVETGNNFTITPMTVEPHYEAIHEFEPSQRVVFIGDGAIMQDGQNFTDISAFTVHGEVYYQDLHDTNGNGVIEEKGTCVVKNADVLVDGMAVFNSEGEAVKTDNEGKFTIEVPIGYHKVSVEKDGHVFLNGGKQWRTFEDDLTLDSPFIDITTRTVRGRAVGGLAEASKPIGFDLSTNNIGQAAINFTSQLGGGCSQASVVTDAESGEYEVTLLPENYTISFGEGQNTTPIASNILLDFGTQSVLNLKSVELDSVVNPTDTTDRVYMHKQLDFIYRSTPFISVSTGNADVPNQEFIGAESVIVGSTMFDLRSYHNTHGNTHAFGKPILLKAKPYSLQIEVKEEYVNKDSETHVFDLVSVVDTNASLTILNALSQTGGETLPLNSDKVNYTFNAGFPKVSEDLTNEMLISLVVGTDIITWDAYPDDNNKTNFEAIILGSKPVEGSDFFSAGPDVVDFVLRDPPGDGSYSYFEEGTTLEKETIISSSVENESQTHGGFISAGPELTVNLLFTKATKDVVLEGGFDATRETIISSDEVLVTKETFNQRFQTNTEEGHMQYHGGDLYVGDAKNLVFSQTNKVAFIEEDMWALTDLLVGEAVTVDGVKYKLGIVNSMQVNPANDGMFIYTQEHILYDVIPDLTEARNNLLTSNTGYGQYYTAVFDDMSDEAKFGSNNDASHWTNTGNKHVGESYAFNPPETCPDTLSGCKVDKVRDYNKQIELWKQAILENEKEKVAALSNDEGVTTIALSAGVTYENEKSNSVGKVKTRTIEYHSVDAGEWATGLFINDVGAQYQGSHMVEVTEIHYDPKREVEFGDIEETDCNSSVAESALIGYALAGAPGAVTGAVVSAMGDFMEGCDDQNSNSGSQVTDTTTTFGYVLYDETPGDSYLIDVHPGNGKNGPIFIVQGGETACPYYPVYHTECYTDDQGNAVALNAGTIQREIPVLSINGQSNATLSNIPENEAATFTLTLTNGSHAHDQYFGLKVLDSSNPNGAILKVDGINPNREYLVEHNSSITKTLTIEKGPEALDYENIKIILHSVCQYDPTNNVPDIYDEVTVTAKFLPTCTDINFVQPDPNWVVNTNYENEEGMTIMNAIMSGYNLNYYSLDKINFEYKPSSSSNWNILKSYHKEVEEDSDESQIPTDNAYILYEWDMSDMVDGDYDIRALTNCGENQGNPVEIYTDIYSGHVDRVRPHNFGSPSPADGILDPNDEIQINFNENINEAILGYPNFSISGVLNGSEIRHDASLYFDGADAMTIPTGLNLQNKSFTIETWLNKQAEGAQSILKQGYADGDQMEFRVNDANQLEFTLSNTTVTSTTAIDSDKWQHVSVVYNKESNTVSFFIGGKEPSTTDAGQTLLADYKGEGPITVASDFVGNMHELRLWKAAKGLGDISAQSLKTQSGKEANLLGLWPMDELEGNPQDKARARHASTTATWQVRPGGSAYSFNAANQEYLSADVSNLSFREDQDFTIEMWFKSNGTSQTLLSNGTMFSATDGSLFGNSKGWTLQLNGEGKVELVQNQEVLSSANAYNDGNWHHIALVKNAKALTVIYVDGEEQASTVSTDFIGFAGSKLALGATPQSSSLNTTYVNHLNGSIDEVRVWTKARKQVQIKRDARAKLSGDEKGLVAYYPFELTTLDNFNQYNTTLIDQHSDTTVYAALNMTGSGSFNSNDKPLVKMARPITAVNFSYSSNGDRVILDITEELSKVEGCILDIEVDGVYDMYGNVMSSPITWTAYINQNQLIWDEQEIQKDKTLGEPLTFTTNIVNQGGLVESFQIDNLPSWLTASPSEGLLQPNSYEQITFVVNDNLFIGDYTEDITLTGNNNYPERLELTMLVEAVQPSYELNPSDFEYTMNFIGQIKVDDIVSRDDKDILFAYVNNELRGAVSPIYIADLDKYYVFMDVYSNDNSNSETLEFRLWDASEGKTHAQVSPENTTFAANTVVGTADNPQLFVASNKLRQEIPLSEGWNWLSYNLDAEDDTIASSILIPTAMAAVNNAQVATVKGQTSFSQYASSMDNWFGSLQAFDMGDMYMVKMNAADTIVYQGATLDLNEHPKTINEGWNWVGYLGQRSMGLSEALSSLNPSANDLIKSQDAFSVYFNESIGWIGSLNALKVGEGYMLKSATAQTLIYPQSTLYGGSSFRLDKNQYPASIWQVQPERYEHSMSVIAQIDHSDYYNPSLDNVLGAFAGDLCLGNIKATAINQYESLYFLTIYGNEGEQLAFNYYDKEKDEVYRATTELAFESNALIGSIENPFPIQIDIASNEEVYDIFSVAIYPNPFADYLELSYSIDKSGEMSIDIYDVMGRHMKSITEDEYQEKGSYKRQIDLSKLNQGVYFIEFKLGDDVFKKMVVKS
jgi:hypothetical protein